ncbi:MAG TPA: 3-deoxy-7-phosphoheptulonate synthase [Bacillota bacterium]|jgi:3-deoxy-7-phosphoheptulonate synthase
MIVVMGPKASQADVDRLLERVRKLGLREHLSVGDERTIIGLIGDVRLVDVAAIEAMPGVERVLRVGHPFKLASRAFHPEPTVVTVDGMAIGGRRLAIMAGPCAVETEEGYLTVARAVRERGATLLRGGAFKPRTSPYSFQGLGREGLRILALAREETGLPVVTEVMRPEDIPTVADVADILQVGARNMQNYALLSELGGCRKPVLLKRGPAASIEEWLMAAEYILSNGNPDVILCERGIRTFESYTRNTLDLSAVALAKRLTHLPVIADPSHGTGRADLVPEMSRAAVAAGADGLIIEVHHNPTEALSDGPQSLLPEAFGELVAGLRPLAEAVGRGI